MATLPPAIPQVVPDVHVLCLLILQRPFRPLSHNLWLGRCPRCRLAKVVCLHHRSTFSRRPIDPVCHPPNAPLPLLLLLLDTKCIIPALVAFSLRRLERLRPLPKLHLIRCSQSQLKQPSTVNLELWQLLHFSLLPFSFLAQEVER